MEEIQEKLKTGGNSPHDLAEMKATLAGEYSFYAGTLEDILTRKPAVWNNLRKNQKSDTSTDRVWEATPDGINETVIRLRLKRIEKLISATNSLIQIAEGQARNSY